MSARCGDGQINFVRWQYVNILLTTCPAAPWLTKKSSFNFLRHPKPHFVHLNHSVTHVKSLSISQWNNWTMTQSLQSKNSNRFSFLQANRKWKRGTKRGLADDVCDFACLLYVAELFIHNCVFAGLRGSGPRKCCFKFNEKPMPQNRVVSYIRTNQQCSNPAVL